jgi:hypothetical protein
MVLAAKGGVEIAFSSGLAGSFLHAPIAIAMRRTRTENGERKTENGKRRMDFLKVFVFINE